MDTKKDIGKLIKERLNDFEQAPDSGTWDEIVKGLDNRKKTPAIFLWLRWGGLALLILIGAGLYWKTSLTTSTPETTPDQHTVVNIPSTNETSNTQNQKEHTDQNTSTTIEKEKTDAPNDAITSQVETPSPSSAALQTQVAGNATTSTNPPSVDGAVVANVTNTIASPNTSSDALTYSEVSPAVYPQEETDQNRYATTGLFAVHQGTKDALTHKQQTNDALLARYKDKTQEELNAAIAVQLSDAEQGLCALDSSSGKRKRSGHC